MDQPPLPHLTGRKNNGTEKPRKSLVFIGAFWLFMLLQVGSIGLFIATPPRQRDPIALMVNVAIAVFPFFLLHAEP